jgi:ubiquitin C-terminal hydrolase
MTRKSETQSENSVSLEPFTEKAAMGWDDTYKLIGVAHHIGPSADSGHYTADAHRKEDNGEGREWVKFDDSSTSKTSIEIQEKPEQLLSALWNIK